MSFINVSPFHEFLSGMNFILQINVGVVKLTGETGTGKTTLLQELVRSTTQAHQDIVAFYSAPASFQQIKDTIREQLGLDPAIDFHDALLVYLLARSFEQRRLILVFDEAEGMDAETLIAVGGLRSIQHAGHNLIGIVLCGRPELTRILRNPEHRLLAKDILLSYELSPLSSQQLPDFCRACLAARGLDSFVLVSDDYRGIMQKSGGLPGKVAEIVETYWPEDMETAASSGKIAPNELPPLATAELRQRLHAALVQPAAATEAKPESVRPVQPEVSFEVTPVIAPDMSFDNLPDAERAAPALSPSEDPDDIQSDIADVPADVLASVLANLPPDLASDDSYEISYDFSYEISYQSPGDALPDVATEVPAKFSADISADVSPDVFNEASSDGAIDPSPVIATDMGAGTESIGATDEPTDDLKAGSNAGPNAGPKRAPYDDSSAAARVVPAPVSSARRSRQQIIIGSLLAASVVIAVVISYVRTPDPDTIATQPVVNVEPAPAPPAQGPADAAVPTVAVQQFGETSEADESPDITTQAIAETNQATEVVPQPLGTEAQATADAAANATTQQPPTAADTQQNAPPVPAPPVSPAAVATIAEVLVTGWSNAWQSQDVDGYLAFYHPEFSPPNQASLENWQNSRRRIITSQSSISITVDDFRVVNNLGNQITVQFLLTYRGDTYADRTVKQLVLQPDAGNELRILREENLQTEVFDPVIEDASSWMTDITPGSTAATETRNYEPVASQLALDDPFPLAGNTTSAGNPAPTATQHRDEDILLAASATEMPASKQPVATDAPVNRVPELQAPATATIPLIFNLTTLSADEVQQINNFLMQWAMAWQTQDTKLYFTHYHPDYKAPESPTVTAWQDERIGKITTPSSISITLSELEILENNDGNVLIELLMEYHADSYGDRTTKRMLLSKSTAAAWLITMEKNLEVETMR